MVSFYTTNGLHNYDTGECCDEGDTVSCIKYTTDRGNIAIIHNVRITDISETDCILNFIRNKAQHHIRVPLNNIIDFSL